ncbi:hypothetical protein MKX01_024433 [Papaver californicum]|nr:hypothetical protein MKX01_024433 [Papaver californicum]
MGNILINLLFEFRWEVHWYWRAFLLEGADKDHPACNHFFPYGVNLNGIKLPKSLFIASGLDILQDRQLAYPEGLKKACQDVKLVYQEQAAVGFYLLTDNDHFNKVMKEIMTFVWYHNQN